MTDNEKTIAAMREMFRVIEQFARWGRNLPDAAELELARKAIARPEVQETIRMLNADLYNGE